MNTNDIPTPSSATAEASPRAEAVRWSAWLGDVGLRLESVICKSVWRIAFVRKVVPSLLIIIRLRFLELRMFLLKLQMCCEQRRIAKFCRLKADNERFISSLQFGKRPVKRSGLVTYADNFRFPF